MRYSDSQPLVVTEPLAGAVSPRSADFVTAVAGAIEPPWAGAILLAGADDWASIAVRRAQSHLRLDRRPSYWSHAAILLEWNASDPAKSWGVEVTFTPQPPERHLPEHNGVTRFHLGDYLDDVRFPNLAIAPLLRPASPPVGRGRGSASSSSSSRATPLVEAALTPHLRGLRYPLFDWIGAWLRYLYSGDAVENPLRAGLPHPGAALVELVLEAGGMAAAPGATEMNLCPELLWSTIRHWHDRISTESGTGIDRAFQLVRDRVGAAEAPLPSRIEPLATAAPVTATGPRGKRR